jgi:hypothetical protein
MAPPAAWEAVQPDMLTLNMTVQPVMFAHTQPPELRADELSWTRTLCNSSDCKAEAYTCGKYAVIHSDCVRR